MCKGAVYHKLGVYVKTFIIYARKLKVSRKHKVSYCYPLGNDYAATVYLPHLNYGVMICFASHPLHSFTT